MLYFVSTPIGNLKDISFRAIEVLNSVDVIACEDTRTSLKLLNAYNIKKRLIAYHKFNEKEESAKIIDLLKSGQSVALITDAGTPLVSDPGNILTRELIAAGIEFTAVPGATAFTPALILSGMDASRFSFIGFLPEKKKDAEKLLVPYKNLPSTLIFYSAPHDIKNTIATLYEFLGDRRAAAVKEITKLHEKTFTFNLADGIGEETPRGEYVIVVEGGTAEENPLNSLSVEEQIEVYIADGLSKMDAVKKVAKERGLKKSDIYKFTINR